MDKRLAFLAFAFCLLAAVSTTRVHAQAAPPVVNPGTADATPQVRTQESGDQDFVAKAAAAGAAEVEAGKLAARKAGSMAVKTLGHQMVLDHGKANAELKGLAKRNGITVAAGTDAKGTESLRRLDAANGAEFDRAYLADQLAAHEEAIALFRKQAESGTNPDLKGFAQRTLPTLQQHLEHVRQLQANPR